MSGFSGTQLRALTRKLDRRHVQSRTSEEGRAVPYLEGWFVVSEANAIFGFSGWDRETVHFEKVFESAAGGETRCGYFARVRIRVRAGTEIIMREGTGFGSASAKDRGQAHERALKGAETDATKRALATFGNRFGLALYDKDQAGVTPEEAPPKSWTVFDQEGQPFVAALSAEGYCSALRQIIEKMASGELQPWHMQNRAGIERLREVLPWLRTSKGTHYADILEGLIARRLAEAKPMEGVSRSGKDGPCLAPSKIAVGPRIDKAALKIGTERRLRDKEHLRFVAGLACLVCAREPSHAHHLTFAQRRGLSQKVSDEFVVPLCSLHHGELHRSGPERNWWQKMGLDPLPIAAELWGRHRSRCNGAAARAEASGLKDETTMHRPRS
jgi:DNA recombination protein Rad52